ncbi:probable leucine--tRNA ligase, mitochondrial isoform X1 [Schistocerca americana]|uniref:probable leucine--tRNA ligase, mitochondrial isoform X1 n=1 Tax=Schistocerca americana TaxID=7009 RepID=UPI001F4FDDF0|nr:probable leucine--tRNA ligase, mitochondrial isoform X1 [Schistocerca americana]
MVPVPASISKAFSSCLLEKLSKYGKNSRCISSGIRRWNEDLSIDIKHSIEEYWKDKLKNPVFDENSDKPKCYVLSMIPYPSGKLHMGHVRVYAISDAMARFHMMNGKNVMHPMGWDAFGLPAENAAIQHKVEPHQWTESNISHMKTQLQKLGCSFDWKRELATCDPKYYQWTQYIFLKLYEAGLVYQKESMVNWDPVDETVLADEQVDVNGCSWRSGAKVEKKLLKQWFIKTTQFSKSLLDGLDDPCLKNWRDVIDLQRHWIGECNGTTLQFELVDVPDANTDNNSKRTLTVWTETPEFIFGASFIAVSPNSVLDQLYGRCEQNICSKGFVKLPIFAKNPFTAQLLPVFVTDQVEFSEGTDTHLGIPGISDSDKDLALSANIPIFSIPEEECSTPEFSSSNSSVREQICHIARQRGIGGYPTSSKLHDWLISRQRYWGTPIPMVHCSNCKGPQPVPVAELPVVLPQLRGKERLSMKEATAWLHTKCPRCKGNAVRETDTMDTFVDSAWYFLRFLDPYNKDVPFNPEKVDGMTPVDIYVGGKEHATLHLYYARFMNHFLHSIKLVPHKEPFARLIVQGMVMGRSYRVKATGKYIPESEVDLSGKKPKEKKTGEPVIVAWEKMSKSKHNGVDPEAVFKEYGVDTARLLILGSVAPTSHRNWSPETFPGILKWQHRLWLTIRTFIEVRSSLSMEQKPTDPAKLEEHEARLLDARNYYLKSITFNYNETYQLSVAISKMQGLTNSLRQTPKEIIATSQQFERALATLIVVLAPMAPHFASELWAGFLAAPHRIDTTSSEILWDAPVHQQKWPDVDQQYILDLLCKVNGADNATVRMPRYEMDNITHDEALELALTQTKVQEMLSGFKIINTQFTLYPGYKAIINIITERSVNSMKQHQEV